MKRVAIWNPASGSAPDEADLREALGATTDLVETTESDPGAGQAETAVADGAELVVACGGDGTVRACLDPLAGTDTALAIVPLGTGNLLASNLGIPSGLEAAPLIGQGRPQRIDLGRVQGEAFAVMAGTGFDAMMIKDASDRTKSRFGTVAYILSGLSNLRTNLVQTHISVDGQDWYEGRTSMVLVGNFGAITGGIEVFPDAQPDDGQLDVAVVSANTWRDWSRLLVDLLRRRSSAHATERTAGRRIEVRHENPRAWELDGEDREPALSLTFTVEPGAIVIHQAGDGA